MFIYTHTQTHTYCKCQSASGLASLYNCQPLSGLYSNHVASPSFLTSVRCAESVTANP